MSRQLCLPLGRHTEVETISMAPIPISAATICHNTAIPTEELAKSFYYPSNRDASMLLYVPRND
jgi:hypothetical protein